MSTIGNINRLNVCRSLDLMNLTGNLMSQPLIWQLVTQYIRNRVLLRPPLCPRPGHGLVDREDHARRLRSRARSPSPWPKLIEKSIRIIDPHRKSMNLQHFSSFFMQIYVRSVSKTAPALSDGLVDREDHARRLRGARERVLLHHDRLPHLQGVCVREARSNSTSVRETR